MEESVMNKSLAELIELMKCLLDEIIVRVMQQAGEC